MDDRFLNEQRREPRPEFARSLRARLRAAEPDEAARPAFRLSSALAGALALAALVAAFTFPAVRATAQQVLDLFRVREFAVVRVDESRLERLRSGQFEPEQLLGGAVETVRDAGPPRYFTDVASAGRAAGFEVRTPAFVAPSLTADTVVVSGESRVRLTVATRPLREAMDLLGITDLRVPDGLDGKVIEARMPAAVVQKFHSSGRRRAALMQAGSPEISLPAGTDLKQLGEIGLRILGVERGEAHRLAGSLDWNGTLLLPVMASATRFQQVSVNGARGVLLQSRSTATPGGSDPGPGTVLMWTRDGRVFALLGNLDELDMMQMAESVR
ncbi:MAG: hypothetical protein IT347_04575 [Candidatus Eisenbacteria bacterium]|nr:hypothetical protein [Candidatus Eisenbacteria bacterium]